MAYQDCSNGSCFVNLSEFDRLNALLDAEDSTNDDPEICCECREVIDECYCENCENCEKHYDDCVCEDDDYYDAEEDDNCVVDPDYGNLEKYDLDMYAD